MIKTELNREDALALLEGGKMFWQESHFSDEPFDPERCWRYMEATLTQPNRYFVAYDSEYRGFILMVASEHWFSGTLRAADMCFYVKPEYRGSKIALQLVRKAEEWAKQIGAKDITIFHNTGIRTEKAEGFFTRIGYPKAGYIFTKEL